MGDRTHPSVLNRILTPILFLVGGFSALSWFVYSIYMLIKGSADSVVLVDKGSYYMFGVGIGMLDLAFVIIWEQWLVKSLTKKVTNIFSSLAVTSIVLLFVLPYAIHYLADNHLKNKGYTVCEVASQQWLFVRDIVYVRDSVVCNENLKKK